LQAFHLEALEPEGLDDLAISDVIHGSAFFNWAKRLMLSLGEPEEPSKG
jgi:alkylhydroperoxidase family enzyme